MRIHRALIRFSGILFLLAGAVHWLILFGFFQEVAPLPITLYFHSMAVLAPLTGIGLWKFKEWARKLGFAIALTQFPAHGVMIYLDTFGRWESGMPPWQRGIDLLLLLAYAIYVHRPTVRRVFAMSNPAGSDRPAGSTP